MTAKKKRVTGGAPAWMVTFADMMALLLCLFVLLLSFSTMDAQKFKRIAGELREAFGLSFQNQVMGIIEPDGSPNRPFATPSVAIPIEPPAQEDIEAQEITPPPEEPEEDEATEEPPSPEQIAATRAQQAERVADQLRQHLSSEIAQQSVIVNASEEGVLIRFDSRFLFGSGNADIFGEIGEVIESLGSILAQTTGDILVSGHTDSVPISTSIFRSNWDLSAARAASLVHLLLRSGEIASGRIAAVGYADSRPIADNATESGREQNRRVEVQIRLP